MRKRFEAIQRTAIVDASQRVMLLPRTNRKQRRGLNKIIKQCLRPTRKHNLSDLEASLGKLLASREAIFSLSPAAAPAVN